MSFLCSQQDYTGVGIANRTSAVFYHRRQRGQPQRVELDPATLATGRWNLLGTFQFAAGKAGSISLSSQADGNVIADAVRFVPQK